MWTLKKEGWFRREATGIDLAMFARLETATGLPASSSWVAIE